MEFGEFVKKHREEKGLTITALAEQSGISRPYLSQIEAGVNPPPSEPKIRRLAEVLEIPFSVIWSLAHQENLSEEYVDEALNYNYLSAKIDVIVNTLESISSNQQELSNRHNITQIFLEIEQIRAKLDDLASTRAPRKYPPTIENHIHKFISLGSHGQGYIKRQVEVYREFWKDLVVDKVAERNISYANQSYAIIEKGDNNDGTKKRK